MGLKTTVIIARRLLIVSLTAVVFAIGMSELVLSNAGRKGRVVSENSLLSCVDNASVRCSSTN